MAESLSGTVSSKSNFLFQNTTVFGLTFSGNPFLDFERNYASTEVSKCYFQSYTVTTTPTAIDLTSLTDVYGAAVSFTTIKHLHIWNTDGTNGLTVGGGTNAVFTALPFALAGITPASGSVGSCLNLDTNLAVTGTTKNLQLAASSGSISVSVLVVGS